MKRILLCLLMFLTIRAFSQDSLTVYTDPIFSGSDNGSSNFRTSGVYTSTTPIVIQDQVTWLNDAETGYQYMGFQISTADYINTISIHFNDFNLPESTDVYIVNENMDFQPFVVTNAFNNDNNEVLLPNIFGNTVMFVCVTTPDLASSVRLGIDAITYSVTADSAYKDGSEPFPFVGDYGTSCSEMENANSVYGNGWSNEIRSVVKFQIYQATASDGPGWYSCTGTLVNQYVSDDQIKPYILTARHCLNDNSDYSNVYVFFNYQSYDENTADVNTSDGQWSDWQSGTNTKTGQPVYWNGQQDGNRWYMQTSISVPYMNLETDMALLELNDPIPPHFNPYYAGWNNAVPVIPPSSAAVIGHPSGDIKKVSWTTAVVDPAPNLTCNTVYKVVDKFIGWLLGTTTTVTQTLFCSLTESPRYFTQYIVGGTQDGSSGSALFSEDHHVIGTLSGGPGSCLGASDSYGKLSQSWIAPFGSAKLQDKLANGNSNISSVDGRQISCYPNLSLNGDYWPASYYQPENQITLSAEATIVAQGETLTTNTIGPNSYQSIPQFVSQQYYQPLEIHSGADFTFTAGTSITLLPGFQVDQGATFAAVIAGCTINGPRMAASSFDANNAINQGTTSSGNTLQGSVRIYPNPTQGVFTISVNYEKNKNVSVTVFNSIGEQIFVQNKGQISQATFQDDLGNLPDGLYIVQVKADSDITTQKIVLAK